VPRDEAHLSRIASDARERCASCRQRILRFSLSLRFNMIGY
jgi:hypothetical protein